MNIYVKCIKTIGDIPEGALGFIKWNIFTNMINYSRVFVPRNYTSLNAELLPCYEMPIETEISTYFTEVQFVLLTNEQKQNLTELETEINNNENLYIGPDGLLITSIGIDAEKVRKMLDKLL